MRFKNTEIIDLHSNGSLIIHEVANVISEHIEKLSSILMRIVKFCEKNV